MKRGMEGRDTGARRSGAARITMEPTCHPPPRVPAVRLSGRPARKASPGTISVETPEFEFKGDPTMRMGDAAGTVAVAIGETQVSFPVTTGRSAGGSPTHSATSSRHRSPRSVESAGAPTSFYVGTPDGRRPAAQPRAWEVSASTKASIWSPRSIETVELRHAAENFRRSCRETCEVSRALSRVAALRGRMAKVAPLLVLLVGVACTALFAGNFSSSRLKIRQAAEATAWEMFVRAGAATAAADAQSELQTAVGKIQRSVMWQGPGSAAGAVDAAMHLSLLAAPAHSGIAGALFARHVAENDAAEVQEEMRTHYGHRISVSAIRNQSGDSDGMSAIVTRAVPATLVDDLVGRHGIDVSVDNFRAAAVKPTANDIVAGAQLGTGWLRTTELNGRVLVSAAVLPVGPEAVRMMHNVTTDMAQLEHIYATVGSTSEQLFGTVAIVYDPTALGQAVQRELAGGIPGGGAPLCVNEDCGILIEDVSRQDVAAESGPAQPSVDRERWEAVCDGSRTSLWTNLDMTDADEDNACAHMDQLEWTAHTAIEFSFFGRTWSIRVGSAGNSRTELDALDAEAVRACWVIGSLSTLLVALCTNWVVTKVSYRKDRNSDKRMRQAAEAALSAHESTVSYACHELRNPLHVMTATGKILADDLDALRARVADTPYSAAATAAAQDVRIVLKSANLMQTVVDDMLDYARLRRGQLEIIPTQINLRSFAQELLILHKSMAMVKLCERVDSAVPQECFLDELRLRQVLQNGITNACKYCKTGSIVLDIKLTRDVDGVVPMTSNADPDSDDESMNTPSEKRATRSAERRPARQRGLASLPGSSVSDADDSDGDSGEPKVYAYVNFQVLDSGPGLQGIDARSLFKPFEQGRGAEDRRHSDGATRRDRSKAGTGLGLAIAYQLVSLMGGKIGLRNRKDEQGTCFWFTLPIFSVVDRPPATSVSIAEGNTNSTAASSLLHRHTSTDASSQTTIVASPGYRDAMVRTTPLGQTADERNRQSRVSAARATLDGKHVVIVDDERVNRRLASRFLASLSVTSEALSDGDEVLPYLREHHATAVGDGSVPPNIISDRLDAILMDVSMRRMHGDETVRQLRKAGVTLPVIACTGHATAADVTRYRGLGFTAVLTKPFSLAEMAATFDSVFRR